MAPEVPITVNVALPVAALAAAIRVNVVERVDDALAAEPDLAIVLQSA